MISRTTSDVVKRKLATCFAVLLTAAQSNAAFALTDQDDIDTNRPTFMDSPLVVPKGSLQLENGTLYQRYQGRLNYFDIPENEVRLGLTRTMELQLFTPNWVRQQSAGSSSSSVVNIAPTDTTNMGGSTSTVQQGVSDLQEIGIKRQFPLAFKNPVLRDVNVAFVTGVTIPTGLRFISGGGVQPSFRVPWTKALSKKWIIGGMQSLLVVNSGRDCQLQNVFSLYRNIGPRTILFTEYAGFYTHQSAPDNLMHFGALRKLSRHQQIGLHFGCGLNNTAPHVFVGAGYSVRIDKIPMLSKL